MLTNVVRRYCSSASSSLKEGVVVSFIGRAPLVKLDEGRTITVEGDNTFVMRDQRLRVEELKEGWKIQSVLPSGKSKGGPSNILWNNVFAKQAKKH